MNFQLFHASSSRFERPDHEAALAVLLVDPSNQKNPKGALGLWTAPFACDGFGSETAALRLSDDARYMSIDIKHLKSLCYSLGESDFLSHEDMANAFVNFREALSSRSDVLLIDDGSGKVGEVVVLNLDAIADWRWLEDAEPRNSSSDRAPLFSTIPIDQSLSNEVASWNFAADGTVRLPRALRP